MKCKHCNGTGEIINDALRWTSCPACGGKGEIELTNEEWLCELSTKEKAEFLSNSGMFESYNEALFWLKEKHNDLS